MYCWLPRVDCKTTRNWFADLQLGPSISIQTSHFLLYLVNQASDCEFSTLCRSLWLQQKKILFLLLPVTCTLHHVFTVDAVSECNSSSGFWVFMCVYVSVLSLQVWQNNKWLWYTVSWTQPKNRDVQDAAGMVIQKVRSCFLLLHLCFST